MKNLLLTLFFSFILSTIGISQQIYSIPELPINNEQLNILFDVNQCDCSLIGYTGDIYAHTGIIRKGDNSWSDVIGSWGDNSEQPKLTHQGNGIYIMEIRPTIGEFYDVQSEVIDKIAVVFRSSDGTKQTADLFLQVFSTSGISFVSPEDKSIHMIDDDISVEAISLGATSIELFIDEVSAYQVDGDMLNYNYTPTSAGIKNLVVKAIVDGEERSASAGILVLESDKIASLPSGLSSGVNISGDTATFVIRAPGKDHIVLVGDFNDWSPSEDDQMYRTPDTEYFWTQKTGLDTDKTYGYQYILEGGLNIADPYASRLLDPNNDPFISQETYPDLEEYPYEKTDDLISIFDFKADYVWNVSTFERPEEGKLVIYELLIRDFLAEHNYKALESYLDYIKDLGVNAIELMPVNEFEGNSSWGYNTSFHMALDKYYGTEDQFKAFIDLCHEKDIAIILDLVINHAYGQNPLVRMYWNDEQSRPAANNPWFNEVSPNQVFSFGYDFDHTSSRTRDYFKDVLAYWIEEYNIDGYRLDFTKGLTNTPGDGGNYDASRIAILKEYYYFIRGIDPTAYVILEHFAPQQEEKELALNGMMLWGNHNHNFSQIAMGYGSDSDFSYMSYKARGMTKPKVVPYMESHDEERQMFKTLTYGNSSEEQNTKELNTAIDRAKMATTLYMCVPGPKLIWMFGELGYDISIDNPCRVCEKPILWEYNTQEARKLLYDHYKLMSVLREESEVFHTDDFTIDGSGLVKSVTLRGEESFILAVANIDVTTQTEQVVFPEQGTYYEVFSESTLEVSDDEVNLTLAPGEYRIYSSKLLSSTEDIDNEDVLIYPNPGNGIINLDYEKLDRNSTIEIYDERGRLVLSKEIYGTEVNLGEDFPAGVYYMKMKRKDSLYYIMRYVKI